MEGHKNVVVFFTDQQRWDTAGVHGNPLSLTPNLDRMAQRGTHLYNTFTCQPVCGPARASLQTGLYATRTGVWRNGIALPAEMKTLAHHFKEASYRTGYIGKWHLANGDPVPPHQQGGYDDWPQEVFIQISEAQVGRAVRTQRWKYSVVAPDRHGGKDMSADRYVEEFLYDLQADPYELSNLIGLESHQEVARALRERLIRRMVQAGEKAPTIEPAPSRPKGQRRVDPDALYT